eukprot:18371-Heterococcus_DN1.PRE.4
MPGYIHTRPCTIKILLYYACKVLARVKQGHANIAVVAAAALRTAPNMVLDYYSYYSVTI